MGHTPFGGLHHKVYASYKSQSVPLVLQFALPHFLIQEILRLARSNGLNESISWRGNRAFLALSMLTWDDLSPQFESCHGCWGMPHLVPRALRTCRLGMHGRRAKVAGTTTFHAANLLTQFRRAFQPVCPECNLLRCGLLWLWWCI